MRHAARSAPGRSALDAADGDVGRLRPTGSLRMPVVTLVAVIAALAAASEPIDADGRDLVVSGSAAASSTATRTGSVVTLAEPSEPPAAPSTRAARIRDLVNDERRAHGVAPVRLEARLSRAAQDHSADQAAQGQVFHVADDGTGPGDRIAATGYEYAVAGENVAAGQATPEQVMADWMSSPGHCRNVLEPAFTELGVGVVEAPGDRFGIYWTQKFARPTDAARPAGSVDPSWC